MRVRSAAAVVLVAALALAGCSDDDPPDPQPSAGTSGTPSPSPSATPTAEPKEPALPDAATKATEAGARAFITYYWDLINYAQVTGDVKALKKVSAASCSVCNGFVVDLKKLYRDGGHLTGGTNEVTITTAAELTTENDSAFGFRIELDVAHDEQIVTDASGSEDRRLAGRNRFTAYLLWSDEMRWRTDVLDLH